MKYELPALPYAPNALEPAISAETLEYHHGKHLKTYLDNLNKLIANTPYEKQKLETIIEIAEGALYNNAAQAWNHIFYFETFSPRGRRYPEGPLKEEIEKTWGSFDNFRTVFTEAAVTLFGSGWAWLVSDASGHLSIRQEGNAGTPITKGLEPLLAFDVWEHAYYIDSRNRRAEHIGKLWDILDWEKIESRYSR